MEGKKPLMKFRFIEGTKKDGIGGAVAGVCSVLGIFAAFGIKPVPIQMSLLLIPATLLIPRFVFRITKEEEKHEEYPNRKEDS